MSNSNNLPIIPNLPPQNLPFVKKHKDGNYYLTDEWYGHLSNQTLALHGTILPGYEGLVPPSNSATNIALLTNSANGTIIYNADTDKLNTVIAGIYKEITTS